MHDFNFHRPASLDEALKIFADSDDGQFMAGGQTIIPVMKQRLSMYLDIIDLGAIAELNSISVDRGIVSIGAMTPHANVAGSDLVNNAIPALAALAGGIGDPHVRNRGTLGGSIANNDPAADYPAAIVGLDATIRTNRRSLAGDDFFTDLFETALDEGELITAVDFPIPDNAAYEKFANPASRFAMVGVMVSRKAGAVRVAVTGAGPCVFRIAEMEQALASDFSAGALHGIRIDADGLNTDIHASAGYRAHLIGVLAGRAVSRMA